MRPKTPQELFVWIWLPGALDPVVAGVLTPTKQIVNKEVAVAFRYAKSYQTLANAISLFTPVHFLYTAAFVIARQIIGVAALSTKGLLLISQLI